MPSASSAAPAQHAGVAPPACDDCSADGKGVLDMECRECMRLLTNPNTTISQLFAVLRQWDPATQNKIDVIVNEMFKRGLKVNDQDTITGQTVLHFACKSGARGVGDEKLAEKVVSDLLGRGADVNAVSPWTNMTPAHVAAFFGCDLALAALCTAGANLKVPCSEFDNATPLHLAAMAGSLPAVKTLLRFKADPLARDRQHRTPVNAAKLVLSGGVDAGAQELTDVINFLVDVEENQPTTRGTASTPAKSTPVRGAVSSSGTSGIPGASKASSATPVLTAGISSGRATSSSGSTSTTRGISLGGGLGASDTGPSTPSRIPSSGASRGAAPAAATPNTSTRTLSTPSKSSALPRPTISPGSSTPRTPSASTATSGAGATPRGGVSAATPASKLRTPSNISRPTIASSGGAAARTPATPRGGGPRTDPTTKLPLGSRVLVGQKHGVVRYIGETQFGDGLFIGVELDEPEGRNDGSKDGIRYFEAEENHGVFVRPQGCTFRGVDCATLFA